MSKKLDSKTADDAFEMIELAIDDLSVLTRAFDVINEACKEFSGASSDDVSVEEYLH